VPEAAFVVIESCSGLGSMRVLAFLAASYAMAFRVGFLHGLALVLAAPAIAFALNGVRVMFTAIHPHSEAWGDHSTQGLVVFAIGTLVLAALDFVLSLRGRAEARAPEVGGPGFDARTGITGLWVGALAFVLVSFVPPFELGPRLDLPNVLPRGLEGWAFEEKERLPLQFLGRVGYSQAGLARFSHVDEAHEVELFVGLEEFRERGKSGLSRKNSLPGSPWESQGPGRIVVPGFTLNDHRIRRNQEERLVYWEELGARSRPSEALRQFLGVDRSPWRRERPAWVIRLSTPVEPGPAGPTYARGRLRRFLKALRPQWEFRLRQG